MVHRPKRNGAPPGDELAAETAGLAGIVLHLHATDEGLGEAGEWFTGGVTVLGDEPLFAHWLRHSAF